MDIRWAKWDGVPSYDVFSRILRLGMTTRELFGIDSQEPETSKETPTKFDRRIVEAVIEALKRGCET